MIKRSNIFIAVAVFEMVKDIFVYIYKSHSLNHLFLNLGMDALFILMFWKAFPNLKKWLA